MKLYKKILLIFCIAVCFYYAILPFILLLLIAFLSAWFDDILSIIFQNYLDSLNLYSFLLFCASNIGLYLFYRKTRNQIGINNIIVICLSFGVLVELFYILGFLAIGVFKF